MPPAIAHAFDTALTDNASLAGLVADLQSIMTRDNGMDQLSWTMFQRMFAVAAETEQALAEQRSRIDYLESLSVTDELTQLYNRRGMFQILENVLANARRHKECGVLAYIDLDGFKQINDSYGHEAGDAVLKHVAETLLRQTRSTDYVGRLGGDEFVVLFCRAQQMPTRARAMQMRDELNASVATYSGQKIPVRASLGLEIYGPYSEASELIRYADAAMYREKEMRKGNK